MWLLVARVRCRPMRLRRSRSAAIGNCFPNCKERTLIEIGSDRVAREEVKKGTSMIRTVIFGTACLLAATAAMAQQSNPSGATSPGASSSTQCWDSATNQVRSQSGSSNMAGGSSSSVTGSGSTGSSSPGSTGSGGATSGSGSGVTSSGAGSSGAGTGGATTGSGSAASSSGSQRPAGMANC